MAVYFISGAKNKDRITKSEDMISEFFNDKNFSKTVDYKIIDTEEGKKNISIDQIRTIEEFIISKPIEKDLKVIFIKNSDRLSIEAQNAILKTLEEPPAYVRFILEASRKRSLLKTLISRCIIIDLGSEEKIDIETNDHSGYVDAFLALLKKDVGARFDWIAENKDLVKDGDAFGEYLNSWESFLRDILIVEKVDKSVIKNKYKLTELAEYKKLLSDDSVVENAVRQLLRAKAAAQSNVNKSLIAENLLVALPCLK